MKSNQSQNKKVAKERINDLFIEAEKAFSDKDLGPSYSNRYVELARKIAMKYNVRIPSEFKRQFCKYCYSYLVPSINCTVRLNNSKVIYHCNECKKIARFPYLREQKEKRKKL